MPYKFRLFAAAILLCSACEGSLDQAHSGDPDVGTDAPSDADVHLDSGGTHDAGVDLSDLDAMFDDASWDTGADVSEDTNNMPEDSGQDTGGDSGGDTGEDVGQDGGPADAATDTDPGPTCGNGLIDAGEECDQNALGGESCASLDATKPLGPLTCAANCSFDTTACMAVPCGNGVIDAGEECDQNALGGESCASLDATKPLGPLTCAANCTFNTTACTAMPPGDADNDGVLDPNDPAPNNHRICGDSDADGCDDCSVTGTYNTSNDGYDPNNDGQCELPLDFECMNGANAASDPHRREACVMFTLVNQDRALFTQESGGGVPVGWNEAIWEVAHAHAVDMCTRGYFAHNTPEGVTPSQRAAAAGLTFSIFENISVNLDPQASQWGFMEEPTCTGHRGTILQKRATEVGIGYFKCANPDTTYQWRNHHHIVQNFRVDFNIPQNTWCQTATNACEIPPTPPTTAVCPQQLVNWGFCPQPSPTTLQGWNCPND